MFVQSTIEFDQSTAESIIKKAWKPGFRIVGNDTNGRLRGTEELAAVLGYADLDDMHEILIYLFAEYCVQHGLAKRAATNDYTIIYSVR